MKVSSAALVLLCRALRFVPADRPRVFQGSRGPKPGAPAFLCVSRRADLLAAHTGTVLLRIVATIVGSCMLPPWSQLPEMVVTEQVPEKSGNQLAQLNLRV